jgi:hypothetical protein
MREYADDAYWLNLLSLIGLTVIFEVTCMEKNFVAIISSHLWNHILIKFAIRVTRKFSYLMCFLVNIINGVGV